MYLQLIVKGRSLLQFASFRICIFLPDDCQYVWPNQVAENKNEWSLCVVFVWAVLLAIDRQNRIMWLKLEFFLGAAAPHWARAFSFMRFLDHTQRRTTGLLWTSNQLVANTSTKKHITLTTDINATGEIRTHNLSRRAPADLCLRPRGHWNRSN
jgi:hypothetical protein